MSQSGTALDFKEYTEQMLVMFVLRRVFRCAERSIRVRDLADAFTLPSTRCAAVVAAALARHPNSLQRQRQGHRIVAVGDAPAEASYWFLLEQLENGVSGFVELGLHEHELPVRRRQLRNMLPASDAVTGLVMRAIIAGDLLDIVVVSMELGDSGASYRVRPLELERTDAGWQLVGRNVQMLGEPVESFLLTRILSAEVAPAPRKGVRNVRQEAPEDRPTEGRQVMEVVLDDRLTDAQVRVTVNEFALGGAIRGDQYRRTIAIPGSRRQDFALSFSKSPPTTSVWPPIVSLGRSR